MSIQFFDINSVAIIGASESEGKIGNDLIKNLVDFTGEKYGVNPKGGAFKGIEFIKNISSLPIVPDIAVMAIPAKFVLSSLVECGEKGIKRVIVISAGFKETGNIEGEEEIQKIAKKYDIRVLGPNCLGYIDTYKNLNLSFGSKNVQKCIRPTCHNISMISQSGAMAVAFSDMANSFEMGFSKIISMGNKSDINENDLLKELALDDNTETIVIYLESIEFGREFFEIAKEITKKKPIVVVKAGVSSRGELAASSHTGALASSYDILKTAFDQSGIHMTNSLEDFFLWGKTLSRSVGINIPEELVIITNAGGPGVMVTDHSEFNGIKLASFTDTEKNILMDGMPDSASVSNPIDVIGDATSIRYKQILENIKKLDRNLAILVMLTPQTVTDVENIANVVIDFEKQNKSIIVMTSFMGGQSIKSGRDLLHAADILDFNYPKNAVISFSRLVKQKKWQNHVETEVKCISNPDIDIINKLKKSFESQEKICDGDLTSEIFSLFGVNHLKETLVKNESDIEKIFSDYKGNHLVARIASNDIAHKTDVGGVILNINGLEEAKKAYNDILSNVKEKSPKSSIQGVTFSPMIIKDESTKEIFVGFKRDASFGDILILGMGGIFVNIFEDVTRRLSPVSKSDIKKMFLELHSSEILSGVRGQEGINFDSLSKLIYKLQFIFKEFSEIKEIDINPVFSNKNESIIVDAKLYL